MAPVCDEGGEGAAFNAVGDVVDCFADDVVSAADSERLFSKQKSVNCSFGLGGREKEGQTIPWPENWESVFRMQYAAE